MWHNNTTSMFIKEIVSASMHIVKYDVYHIIFFPFLMQWVNSEQHLPPHYHLQGFLPLNQTTLLAP